MADPRRQSETRPAAQPGRQTAGHPSGASLSNREIARHCGVDHKTVGDIRSGGEQRVRGVNGSKRWCIGCGANWPTAETFLAAVASAERNGSTTVRRERLAARFNDLLPHLTPAQIERLEAALAALQT